MHGEAIVGISALMRKKNRENFDILFRIGMFYINQYVKV